MIDKNLAFIFARGGSKGLPGKNIKLLAKKPLIAWSIESALSVDSIDNVYVSTDCNKIAEVAIKYGAKVPYMRPKNLAGDNSPELLSWKHALEFYQRKNNGNLPNKIISIPTTAPLRSYLDIQKCIEEYEKGKVDVVITVTESSRNPYFNMVKKNSNGTVSLVMESSSEPTRRQDAPKVYDMATVAYVAKPEFIMKHQSLFDGKVAAVNVPIERAIDIDTLSDFKMAEFYLSKKEDKR
jgi:CMP-N-acetylneuraminic acid synthetase